MKGYEEQFKIDDKGIVKDDRIAYGQVVKYSLPVLPEATMAVKRAMMNISKPLL